PPRLHDPGCPSAPNRERQRAPEGARGAARLRRVRAGIRPRRGHAPDHPLPGCSDPVPAAEQRTADRADRRSGGRAGGAGRRRPRPAAGLRPGVGRAPSHLPGAGPRQPGRPRVRPGRRRPGDHRRCVRSLRPSPEADRAGSRASAGGCRGRPSAQGAREADRGSRQTHRPSRPDGGGAGRGRYGRVVVPGSDGCSGWRGGASDTRDKRAAGVGRGGDVSPSAAGSSRELDQMATVVGVVFQPGGKVYSFDPAGLELRWDEHVICQTARGRELGRVVQANHDMPNSELTGPLKRVIRRAGADDLEQVRKNRIEAKRSMLLFRELARRFELPVKPLSAEMVFDQSRIVFSYGSEERLDTQALQSELAKRLNRRVEVRAVGPREGARLSGGGGLCGPTKCCNRYPSHESPITLKMAKDQELPMNPGRITGLCGRLRCCLAFEHPVYRSFRDRAPAVGRIVTTPQGRGVVRSYEVLRDACVVEMEGEKEMLEVKLDDLADVTA